MQIDASPGRRAHWQPSAVAAVVMVSLAIAAPVTRGQGPQTGSITGRVKLTTRVRGAALSTNAYSPRSVGLQDASPFPEMRNVVVYLKGVTYRGALPATRRQVRQEHESFVPRVVAITAGSIVDFPNGDPFFHNVFSLSGAGTFDLGRYPDGQSRSRQFTKAGLVKVYCRIHSHMSASILILDHPYFAIPEDDGGFTLPNIPAGDYRLVAWHERVGEQVIRLSVQPGQATTIEISLPVADAP